MDPPNEVLNLLESLVGAMFAYENHGYRVGSSRDLCHCPCVTSARHRDVKKRVFEAPLGRRDSRVSHARSLLACTRPHLRILTTHILQYVHVGQPKNETTGSAKVTNNIPFAHDLSSSFS